MNHSFNVEMAERYGINCSILAEHLYFWIKKNMANEVNCYDGRYWTYNSINAFEELFPYMTKNQIRNALIKLEKEGLIITGNYNKSAYDRTKWYAFTDFGFSILQNNKMDFDENKNQTLQNVKPIPDINSDINSDRYIGEFPLEPHDEQEQTIDEDNDSEKIPYNDIIDYLNKKTNKHFRPNINKTRSAIKSRWKEGFRESDFKYVIDVKCSQWLNDSQMSKYLRPETLFGNKFESYLNEEINSSGDIWDRMLRGEV